MSPRQCSTSKSLDRDAGQGSLSISACVRSESPQPRRNLVQGMLRKLCTRLSAAEQVSLSEKSVFGWSWPLRAG